mgnify:CR=1 FL=1
MRPTLRPYQENLKQVVYCEWEAGHKNVLAVLPTGAGKTVMFSDIIHNHDAPSVVIAHRRELLGQSSLALARNGIRHRIIAPDSVVRECVKLHCAEVGTSYYSPNAKCAVASVDSLKSRREKLDRWLLEVRLCVIDEAHHIVLKNKWGDALCMFPNAKLLGVTATPTRADGLGLGAHADGVMDVMVEGPTMRDLINADFLTGYRVFAPTSDLDMTTLKVGSTGDYTRVTIKEAVRESHIIGDIVVNYLSIAVGKLGVCFASDVETATDIAQSFNDAGVPAAVVSAKTPALERREALDKFRRRELLMLVNVDLFGEGFDLPAIEVVIMARPTQSYALYVQQFGRGLRLMDGKENAIVIDHVGNVIRHGLPDSPKLWTLDRREKRGSKKDETFETLRACPECAAVYERFHRECPYCGFYIEPLVRSAPEFVEGDLMELDEAVLAQMRGDIELADLPVPEYKARLEARGAPRVGVLSHGKRHGAKQDAQAVLRVAMAQWGGYQSVRGIGASGTQRRFYSKFRIDVWSAQVLGVDDATELTERINEHIAIGVL